MSDFDRRAFLAHAARAACAGVLGGTVLGSLRLVHAETPDYAQSPLELRPLPPIRVQQSLRPSGTDDTSRIRAALKGVADRGGGEVVLERVAGRPFRFDGGDLRVPTGVVLRGPGTGSARMQLRTSRLHRVVLESDAHLVDVHLIGPGRNLFTDRAHRGRVVPGIDSGGRMDLRTGRVLSRVRDWSVRGCRIEEFTGAGINTGWAADAGQIAYTESVHNGNAGLQIGLLCHGFQVWASAFSDNGANGLDCNGSGCVLADNDCNRNGWSRLWDTERGRSSDRNGILLLTGTFRDTGIPFHARRNQVRGNRCSGNERAGIMIAATAPRGVEVVQEAALIERNRVQENGSSGLLIEGAGGGLCRHTVFRRNESSRNGIDAAQRAWGFAYIGDRVPGTRLEHNTFVANKSGCWLDGPQIEELRSRCG